MSQDNKEESGGLLHRLFGRGGHETTRPDAHSGPRTKTTLDLGDIQGFILRGYRMPMVRHFLLTVGIPAAARVLLGRLVSGDESDAPQITTAEDWHVGFEPGPGDNLAEAPRRKPDYCLNLGMTWPGLVALEINERVPTVSFKSFGAYVAGAAERAALVGDTGAGGPQHWIGAFGTGSAHVLVTLHAISPEAMTTYSDRLSALFAEGDALREIWRGDGMALTEIKDGKPVFTSKVHFGYTDGISMTTIRGGPERYHPDHQQPCEHWLFVLRDEAENYFVPEPRELGLNGSFAVFKMIQTDVVGFETFLQAHKDTIDPELLAAKMCGRWRNGVPLALSPETDSPPGGIPPEQLNNFEYVNADGSGDPKGLRCPVGAHMRRINPRGQPIAGQAQPGGSNTTHRLIRRGMPYGPNYDPKANSDFKADVRALSFSVDLTRDGTADPDANVGRQDFSLQNATTLPINDARAFLATMKLLTASNPAAGLWSLPFKDKLRVLRTLVLVQVQARQTIKPYQQLRYWSTVPFRHGPIDVVMHSATPSADNPARPLHRSHPNALQDELIRHLNEDSKMSAFDFGLQFLDADRMTYWGKRRDANFWIENASVEWNEAEAPFHTVARLTLLSKSELPPDESEAAYFDVTGHATPDSTPVGSIKRVRWPAEVASRKARMRADRSGEP